MTTTLLELPEADTSNFEHVVLHNISWELYEQILKQVGDQHIRMTYDNGDLEIISPLSEHEVVKTVVARMLEQMASDLDIPLACYGSTTFRRKDLKKGAEPDECYYIQHHAQVPYMKRFNPKKHPAPDLVLEIDITSRTISKRPIYAALGVLEIWSFDGHDIHFLVRDKAGKYKSVEKSAAFPFLSPGDLNRFIHRLATVGQVALIVQWRDWVRKNLSGKI